MKYKITMILDLSKKNGTLTYIFDDYHHLIANKNNIAADKIDVNNDYCLAVAMYYGNKMALVDI